MSSKPFVEVHVAGQIRHADRVAVRADAVDDAARDVTLMRIRIFDAPEPQRIGHGNHFGAHAQHVADDAADAGRRAFERDDLRRMVVRFVRDDDTVALAVVFAEVQDAGVFARPDHDVRSGRRQRLEVMTARFIAAMLAPLRVERMQFDDARFAPEFLRDSRQLVVAQGERGAKAFVNQALHPMEPAAAARRPHA